MYKAHGVESLALLNLRPLLLSLVSCGLPGLLPPFSAFCLYSLAPFSGPLPLLDMKFSVLSGLLAATSTANGAVLWDGRFNDLSSARDLNTWSWSNQVGPYQYYIHGSGSVDKYINLSPGLYP